VKATEAAKLCQFAKAACPAQAIDQDTPAAWFVLLSDLRFEDAQEALVNVVRKQPFVAPAEIRTEVRRIRAARLTAFGPIPAPPKELEDAAYRKWLLDAQRRIADGAVTSLDQLGVLPPASGKRPLELEGLFQQVPADDREPEQSPKKPRPRKRAAGE
jgi:hypothetical protein